MTGTGNFLKEGAKKAQNVFMRTVRAFPSDGSQAGFFHCLSRVVDRRFILGDPEKETFRKILRACETFYGLKVLTYCIMSNHFHVLVEVPEPQELTEEEGLRRIAALPGS